MRKDMERVCAVCGELIPLTRPGNNTKYCSLKCARRAGAQQNIAYLRARTTRHNRIAFDVCCAYDGKYPLSSSQSRERYSLHTETKYTT